MAANNKDQDGTDKLLKTSGGVALGFGVKELADGVLPGSGTAASIAAAFAPDRAKKGAAVGALVGAGAASHVISAGTAGAIAFGMSTFFPVVLAFGLIGGCAAWLLGGGKQPNQEK